MKLCVKAVFELLPSICVEKVASGPGGPVPPGPWRLSCTVWCIGSWEKGCPASPKSRSLLNTWRNLCAIYSNIQKQFHILSISPLSKSNELKTHKHQESLFSKQQRSSLVVGLMGIFISNNSINLIAQIL